MRITSPNVTTPPSTAKTSVPGASASVVLVRGHICRDHGRAFDMLVEVFSTRVADAWPDVLRARAVSSEPSDEQAVTMKTNTTTRDRISLKARNQHI